MTAQSISLAELAQYKTLIENEGLEGALQVYEIFYSKGYNYAGWAAGVARGDSIAGQAALDFLQSTALMGMGGKGVQDLTLLQIDQIRIDMALHYVGTLEANAEKSGTGSVSEDVTLSEVTNFHEDVFTKHHLTLENWTLATPMELIARTEGSQAAEDLWVRIRDTGGDYLDAMIINLELAQQVSDLASDPDPSISGPAQEWMDLTPGVNTLAQWGRAFEVVWDALNETTAYITAEGSVQTRHYLSGMMVETGIHSLQMAAYGTVQVGADAVPYAMKVTSPEGWTDGTVLYIGFDGMVTTVDGRVTQQDVMYADGGRLTTEFDFDGNISKTTEIEIDGDKTETQFDSEGHVRRLTETDGAGDNPDYQVRTTAYDSNGSLDYVNIEFDDGSQIETDYDQDETKPWSRIETHFDTAGREDYADTFLDDGVSYRDDYDQDETKAWRRVETWYDAEGREFMTEKIMDDGRRDWINLDVDGSQPYSRIETHAAADGRRDWEQTIMDDGSKTWIDYDLENSQEWSIVFSRFDAQGREDMSTFIMDDGSMISYDYDQDGSQPWSLIEIHNGTQVITTLDNGEVIVG